MFLKVNHTESEMVTDRDLRNKKTLPANPEEKGDDWKFLKTNNPSLIEARLACAKKQRS